MSTSFILPKSSRRIWKMPDGVPVRSGKQLDEFLAMRDAIIQHERRKFTMRLIEDGTLVFDKWDELVTIYVKGKIVCALDMADDDEFSKKELIATVINSCAAMMGVEL